MRRPTRNSARAIGFAAGVLCLGWGVSSAFAQANEKKPESSATNAPTAPQGAKETRKPVRAKPAASSPQGAQAGAANEDKKARDGAAQKKRAKLNQRAGASEPAQANSARAPSEGNAGEANAARAKPGDLKSRDVPATVAPTALFQPRLERVPTPQGPEVNPIAPDAPTSVAVKKPRPVTPEPTLPPPPNKADLALRERVQRALMQDKSLTYSARGIHVDAHEGEVTLMGELNTQFEKIRAARTAATVAGARAVHNRVTVRNNQGETLETGAP